MKPLFRLLAFLFVAANGNAQIIQHKSLTMNPLTGFVYNESGSLDNPTRSGDLLITVALGACPEGPACATTISDSQGNVWKTAVTVPYDGGQPLWYTTAKDGAETVYFVANTTRLADIAEYPPAIGLDDANYGTYQGQNPNGDAQGQSSDTGSTMVLATSAPGDLLITWGWSGGPMIGDGVAENEQYIITAGPGFTKRSQMYGGWIFEDSITTIPGAYFGTVFWAGYGHWVLGAAAFRMVTPLVKACP